MGLYDRAVVIPGRSCTRSKSPDRLLRAWELRSEGAVIWDTEGREYIDCVCALGANSLGYQEPRYCGPGVSSLPSRYEPVAAEAVLRHVAPWATHVRFTKTGTESTLAALMMAKAATGRKKFAMGSWAYHGWVEQFTEMSESRVLFEHGGNPFESGEALAAVFIEPHRFEKVDEAWLRWLRTACDHSGTLLVFDEMVQGGRLAMGGGCEYFGIRADLSCYGKAIGNSHSAACVVGRDVLERYGELASGTFSGEKTGLLAVIDTLETYARDGVLDIMRVRGRQLIEGLRQVIPNELGSIEGMPTHHRIRFRDPETNQPYDYRPSEARPLNHKFKEAMARRGILVYPDWLMISAAHTEQQIDQVIQAAAESVKELV